MLLHQQPPRLQRGGELRQHLLPLRQVHEHQPDMHEVEGALGRRRAGDVLLTHLQVRHRLPLQEARVQVHRQHPASRAYLLAQPEGDGATAEAQLEAVPALARAEGLDAPVGGGI